MTVTDLKNELHLRDEKIALLEAELKWQKAKFEALERRVFGSKSERVTQEDLQSFFPQIQETPGNVYQAPEVVVTTRTKQVVERTGGVRANIPDHIERVEVELVPLEVKAAPENYCKIGQEVTERLDYKPGKIFCRRYIQPKYKNLLEVNQIVQRVPPLTVVDRCLAEPGLVAHVILSKYDLHLPNYRLSKYFREAFGIDLHRNLLGDWEKFGSQLLEPIYDAMVRHIQAARYLQIDETPVKYLDPEIKGKSGTGQLWEYGAPKGEIIFEWRTDRSREGPEKFLKDFRGTVQSDRYSAYESLEKLRPDIVFAACWAHVRRKFVEAMQQKDPSAGWFVARIGELYEIERNMRELNASAEQRKIVRCEMVPSIMHQIWVELEKARPSVLPQSHFGKAVLYAHKNWKQLQVYLNDGEVEIDTNLCENSIRPTAIGKKNWLFIGSPTAGDKGAIIYSLIGSCRRLGINPHQYLTEVIAMLPAMKIKNVAELEPLTPSGWLRARN